MQSQTALVIGATGLIGRHVVEQLLDDPAFEKVRVLVRRFYNVIHPRLEVQTVNFNYVEDQSAKFGQGDCILCCIGTTQKKVKGDKAAYRKVDYDIAVNTAKIGKQAGFKKYLLVSSIGANENASNFYLKLKGEIERDITKIEFESLHIFRPSILLGQRQEFRIGELIGKRFTQVFSFLMTGSLRKYKPVFAEDVAKAMVAAAKQEAKGNFIYTYDEIKRHSTE